MKKKIKLNTRFAKFDSSEPFVLSENETLTFEIDGSIPAIYRAYLIIKDRRYLVVSKKVEIFPKELQEGQNEIAIELFYNGSKIKSIPCEFLSVVKKDAKMEAIPQVELLERRVAKVEKALIQIKKFLENLGKVGE